MLLIASGLETLLLLEIGRNAWLGFCQTVQRRVCPCFPRGCHVFKIRPRTAREVTLAGRIDHAD